MTTQSQEPLNTFLICYGADNAFWLCEAEDRDHAAEKFEDAGMDGSINEVFECIPATNRYFVRQRRAMWVCFVQEVEAEDGDAALAAFRDHFDPQHAFVEEPMPLADHGPVRVFDRREFPTAQEVTDA